MRAHRGKIGFICPAGDTGGLEEHFELLPDGVHMVISTCAVSSLVPEDLKKTYTRYPELAEHMAKQECDVIIMAGSLVFTYMGMATSEDMFKKIRETVKVPIIINLDAHFDALRALGARKIVIATPYEEPRTEERKKLAESRGFQVLATKSANLKRRIDIQQLPPYASYNLAKQAFMEAPEADAIYISCPEWPTIGMIEELERDTGKPVVSPAVAEIWAALKAMHIREPYGGYGKLLELL